jgi:hypothetical protein
MSRLHDLRDSFASMGVVGGLSLPAGALLGHQHAATTARYAHLSADHLRAANDIVGARIAAAMKLEPEGDRAGKIVQISPSVEARVIGYTPEPPTRPL